MTGEHGDGSGSRIFISYRRQETAGHAGHLYDDLAQHFGTDRVFIDVGMEPGVDFADQIEHAVGSSGALVAVIGASWSSVVDEHGERRLDDPEDIHRLEIAGALERGVLVIPALVQGAKMPRTKDLPEELRPLGRRQAVELSDGRWRYDVDHLIGVLERAMAARGGSGGAVGRVVRRIGARLRRFSSRQPLRAGFAGGFVCALAVIGVLLAATGYFTPAQLEITDFRYTPPAEGSSFARRCAVVADSEYRIERARFMVDGKERNVLDEQTREPWQCSNTRNDNRWDTCEGHSREFHLDPGRHKLTATVEDTQGNTASKTIEVLTRCPQDK
jgi:hypothetical protein